MRTTNCAATLVASALLALAGSPTVAAEPAAGSGKGRGPTEAKKDRGPWQVKVPADLRGMTLRVDEEVVPLDQDEVTLKGSDRRQVFELNDEGRIQHTRKVYVDQAALATMSPRHWRYGLFVGHGKVHGNSFDRLLLSGWLNEVAMSGAWQPNAFGLELQLLRQESSAYGGEISSSYNAVQYRVAGTYELAPFAGGSRGARRFHLLGRLGGFAANHRAQIEDSLVTLDDTDRNSGVHGGFDVMINLRSFWLSLRASMSYQRLEFDRFNYKTDAVESSIQFGGEHAF